MDDFPLFTLMDGIGVL